MIKGRTLYSAFLVIDLRMRHSSHNLYPNKSVQKFTETEILSGATLSSNAIYGSRLFSHFEAARVYTRSIFGQPQTKISDDLLAANKDQIDRRALQKLLKSRGSSTFQKNDLILAQKMYYFKNGKFRSWHKAFVRQTGNHSVVLPSSRDHSEQPISAAYEDLKLVSSSSFLRELDETGFIFPCLLHFLTTLIILSCKRPICPKWTITTQKLVVMSIFSLLLMRTHLELLQTRMTLFLMSYTG